MLEGELGFCLYYMGIALVDVHLLHLICDQSANHQWERRHPSLLNRSTKVKLGLEGAVWNYEFGENELQIWRK